MINMEKGWRAIFLASIVATMPNTVAHSAGAPVARDGWFPFAFPWDDAAAGVATDVSFLNDSKPAGAYGRIVVKNGHFAEGDTGRRVRFIGVNMAAESAFPSHAQADRIAGALAKYGINVVRLHHLDNSWGRPGGSLIEQGQPGTMRLNPDSLDKLDYLVAALKRQGIYSNINLKVSHAWTTADGTPAEANASPWSFDKRVDTFDPKIIQLQKDYARQVLTHVNPYTKLSYVDEPAVAFVEINNENSLLGNPMEPLGRQLLSKLAEPYRTELAGQWNVWLNTKYKNDDALKAAWKTGDDAPSRPLLDQKSDWSLEHQGKSDATLKTGVAKHLEEVSPVEINVTAIDGPAWYVQAHLTGLTLQDGKTYTLQFRAKADAKRSVGVSASLDQDDWHNIGLNETVDLTTDWQQFSYVFDCSDPVPQHCRIAWTLGGATGTVSISDISLKSGAAGIGLLPDESLAGGNLKLPPQMSRPQYNDFVNFLADTEHAYADAMRNYLRRDLGVKANITGTQIDYGGLTGMDRENGSDYADAHAYWQHPSFPHKDWDARDWAIQNTPLVGEMAKKVDAGTLTALAKVRVAGRPFTVSEYDHPAPSDYVAEMIPMLSTFASVQDWDGFYLFDLGRPFDEPAGAEHIKGFFDTWDHPLVRAFLPTAALIFRNQQFAPAAATRTLQLPPRAYMRWPFAPTAWKAAAGDPIDVLNTRLAVQVQDQIPALAVTGGTGAAPASGIRIEKTKTGPVWLASSESAVAAAGFLTGSSIACGPLRIDLAGVPFAAVTAVTLDGRPLTASTHVLITVAGGAENPGMEWNAARTSIGNHWGHGPVEAQHVGGTLAIKAGAKSAEAYALDQTGHRGKAIPLTIDSTGAATVKLDADTLWYELKFSR